MCWPFVVTNKTTYKTFGRKAQAMEQEQFSA
jgi:hypothetical protein